MDIILSKYTEGQVSRARGIKVLIFDVDGVLTDGGIIYDNSGNEIKRFNVKDGLIIKHLKNAGIVVGAITGRDSPVVRHRCDELKLDFHFHGIKDKKAQSIEILSRYGASFLETAYLGDDIIDLALIHACGLGVAPADALDYVRQHSDLVTFKKGGDGVLREVGDLILASKGILEKIVGSKLN